MVITRNSKKKNNLKVLIVDDALLVVERLAETISELECVSQVAVATGYDEAIGLIISGKPDIVLLDIHLPEKSGIEILKFVKKSHPGVITVMLTNQSSYNYKILCEQLGSDHFVDKSSEFENIPEIIESYSSIRKQKL
ncbi:MAG: response regulator transcription factor [Ferruginibacter sp.]